MASSINLLSVRSSLQNVLLSRSFHYTFKRVRKPPIRERMESPYIVGPYLKPSYLPVEYTTEPLKSRDDNDLDHFIYEPIKVEYDEKRTVKLLLIDDVEGLGVAGQVVDAPYRMGASKLVAMKKAEFATDFALKWYKFGPKTYQSASSALSPRTARLLGNQIFHLPVSRSAKIEPWHISLALRQAKCRCPAEVIESIDNYIDDDGETQVKCTIRINNHERVEIKFTYTQA